METELIQGLNNLKRRKGKKAKELYQHALRSGKIAPKPSRAQVRRGNAFWFTPRLKG